MMHVNQRLATLYLNHGGFTELATAIHPDDDMYAVLDREPSIRPEAKAFAYFKSGYEALLSLENVVSQLGRSLADFPRVLDFACGYGRITRFLVNAIGPERVHCSDILPGAVEFVRDTLSIHGYRSRTNPRSVRFPRPYDLIFVGSLFSHLPPRRFSQWLRVLYSALSSDGLLVFSTHGEKVRPEVVKDPSGFTFVRRSESAILKKREYGSSFVRPDVVRDLAAAEGIENMLLLEKDLWLLQDLWVVSKRGLRHGSRLAPTSKIYGRLDSVTVDPHGESQASGWAFDWANGAPLAEVSLLVNDLVYPARRGEERPDVAAMFGRDDVRSAGWSASGDSASLPRGELDVLVNGVSSSGVRMIFDVTVTRN